MNIANLQIVLKKLIINKVPITPFIHGRHGVGKTQAIYQVAKELGYDILSIILSQKEAVDIAGVLFTYESKELGMSVTASHPPDWFVTALKNKKVILFFDEFNMARKEVMGAAFQIVLERRLNNVTLSSDTFIICAGNPCDERYDTNDMSESLRDRFMHIKVTPDTDAWLAWARTPNSGIHPDVVKFIEKDPSALNLHDKLDEEFPVKIKQSSRSWERAGRIHNLDLTYNLKHECIRGIVGLDLATAFMNTFGSQNKPLDALEILELNKTTKTKIQEYTTGENLRIDLLTVSIDNLVKFVNKNQEAAFKKIENVKNFIKMLPNDMAQLVISQLFELPGWSESFLDDSELKKKITMISEATAITK